MHPLVAEKMPAPKGETEVLYRGSKEGGPPFCLFPTLWVPPGGEGHCLQWTEGSFFMAADLAWSMEHSRPATPDEALRMRSVLRDTMGWSLKEVKRSTARMDADRRLRMRSLTSSKAAGP